MPPREPKPRKKLIPPALAGYYAPIQQAIAALQRQGKTLTEVCDGLNRQGLTTRTGKPFRHPQQIIKIVRSFPPESR